MNMASSSQTPFVRPPIIHRFAVVLQLSSTLVDLMKNLIEQFIDAMQHIAKWSLPTTIL